MSNYLYDTTERFEELLQRDGTAQNDSKRKSLFWIIAGNDDLYRKSNAIYDFVDHSFKPQCLGIEYGDDGIIECTPSVDLSSDLAALVKLGYALFNGFSVDVMSTFNCLDVDNINLALQAIKIRFNVKDSTAYTIY